MDWGGASLRDPPSRSHWKNKHNVVSTTVTVIVLDETMHLRYIAVCLE